MKRDHRFVVEGLMFDEGKDVKRGQRIVALILAENRAGQQAERDSFRREKRERA